MASVSTSGPTGGVRRQYEFYPYPHRDPDDERKRLISTELDELSAINHYCFRGRRDFTRSMRILVAGGGTGDATIFLAKQLQGTDAKIVHVDMSEASIDVAKRRAEVARVGEQIQWRQCDLCDLPAMGLEPFDYINCSGVLHHLDNPDAGLAALRAVLKPDGAMGIMVYGQYGRTGIYQMQELMRIVNQGEDDPQQKVENTLAVLDRLPETNWLQFRRASTQGADARDPSEVYDRFLHSQDRAYTVPQLYEFLAGAGLNLIEFGRPNRLLYEARCAFSGETLERISKLPRPQQQAAAELVWGNLSMHVFWAAPQADTQVDLEDVDNVPRYVGWARQNNFRDMALACQDGRFTFNVNRSDGICMAMNLPLCPIVRRLLELIDDRRTLGDIFDTIVAEGTSPLSRKKVAIRCHAALKILRRLDFVLMRHRSVPAIGY